MTNLHFWKREMESITRVAKTQRAGMNVGQIVHSITATVGGQSRSRAGPRL